MKKFYHFLICLMLGLLLVACNSSQEGNKEEDKKTESTKDTKKNKKNNKDKDESDEADETDESEDTGESPEDKKTDTKTTTPITIKDPVLLSNGSYSITVKDIIEETEYGYAVNMVIENKTSDKIYTFEVESGVVNGIEVDPYMSTSVSPGKKAISTLYLDDLKSYGIEKYTDIELNLAVREQNGLYSEYTTNETVHIYPDGKENAAGFVYEAKATDQVLVDNEYVSVIYTGEDKDISWGYGINLYIVNKTDKELTIAADFMSINDYMAMSYLERYVSPGKSIFASIDWDEDALKINDLAESDIKDIEFYLRVTNYDDVESVTVFEDAVKIKAK